VIGKPAALMAMDAVMGVWTTTWVALTPFGRVPDLHGSGIDPTFEVPFDRNRRDVARAIEMAHAHGLHVMLVPHLWVETGLWRGEIEPSSDEAWARWAASYRRFLLTWATVAERTHADMFSVGVELRSWVTTPRARSFAAIVRDVRAVYHGVLTYSSNWDDVGDAIILGGIDVIGINAFYPLAEKPNASFAELLEGARQIRKRVHALAETWHKPVVFTETGYTTRPDPAVRPWEWPDTMKDIHVDEAAQAQAYRRTGRLLLPRQHDRKFAVADARGEVFRVAGCRLLPIGRDQFDQREEQRGLREAVTLDPVMTGFSPGVLQVAERELLLLVIRHGFPSRESMRRSPHRHFHMGAPAPRP